MKNLIFVFALMLTMGMVSCGNSKTSANASDSTKVDSDSVALNDSIDSTAVDSAVAHVDSAIVK